MRSATSLGLALSLKRKVSDGCMISFRFAGTRQYCQGKVAFLLLATLIASGCQNKTTEANIKADAGEWISAQQAELEYREEAQSLSLAPGWRWPRGGQYESHAPDGKKINYGINTGRVDAAWYWHCSWARTYFSAASDSERDAALRMVLRLRETAFFDYGLASEDKGPRNRILALAESGDSDPLHDIIETSCPRKD